MFFCSFRFLKEILFRKLKKRANFGDCLPLSGGYYVRSLKGMLIVSEAIRSLQWKSFWLTCDVGKYGDLIPKTCDLKDLLSLRKNIPIMHHQFHNIASHNMTQVLKHDFDNFKESICKQSEQCTYLQSILCIIKI